MSSYLLHVACSPYNSFEKRNIRVQIKCTAVAGITVDTAVFAYRIINGEYIFDHICSTVDMVEYPIADSEYIHNGESFKWCRRDYVDILVRTLSIAEDFIEKVVSDVKLLYYNMEAHNRVVGTDTYCVGVIPENIIVNQNSTNNLITELAVGESVSFDSVTTAGGTLSKQEQDGRYTLYYSAPKDIFGEDSFSYVVTTVDNRNTTYTVVIEILNNATKNIVQKIENTVTGPITITYDSSEFDNWLSGDPASWIIRIISSDYTKHGFIEVLNNTTIRYTPNDGYMGDDDFDYCVSDDTHTIKIHCVIYNIDTRENG